MEGRSNQDILLWLQFKEGSREAFAATYERHGASLIAYGLRICPDREKLKDQVQELFVELAEESRPNRQRQILSFQGLTI
jgi:DNA-directed RNA polymerase specialized sigma24 family protein